jgi:hypothetical protein
MSISMAGVSGEVSLCFLLATFYIFLISLPPLPFFSPSSLFSSLFLLPFSFPFLSLYHSLLFFQLLSFSLPHLSFLPPPLPPPFLSFSLFSLFFSLLSSPSSLFYFPFSLSPFSISLQGVKISLSLSPFLFSPDCLFSPSYFILLLSLFHSPYSLCCRR